tara:strand:+ start:421 stop:636 length:216 start_codon:yes stop_codon:yes gene_type:complete
MFELVAILMGAMFYDDNSAFFKQVAKERKLGYTWEKIERTPAGAWQYEIPAVNDDGSEWILFEHQPPKQSK